MTVRFVVCLFLAGIMAGCTAPEPANEPTDATDGHETSTPPPSTPPPPACLTPPPLERRFHETDYYTGRLIDDHFHMPQFFEIPDHPEAPVFGQDISEKDVACLFDETRIANAFGFYGIPMHLRQKGLDTARSIDEDFPGRVTAFLEYVEFPGYPVDPTEIEAILVADPDLFDGYGEITLYLPHYQSVSPDDPAMRELYAIAESHELVVMMHPVEGNRAAIEAILGDFPNVDFLFHGVESLSWANDMHDTILETYPNAYYSIDIELWGTDDNGRPLFDSADDAEDFESRFTAAWTSNLDFQVARWKDKIEKHPEQFLWGTDRGAHLWHYAAGTSDLLEEFSRAFVGRLGATAQVGFAYGNAERIGVERSAV